MSELRQKFEELPDIKGIIYGSDFGFNESLNQYYHPDHTNHRLNYAFIMGAWYAFQLQQAKIDLIEKEIVETQEFLNKQNYIKQTKIDELKHQKSLQELAINQISQANQEWRSINYEQQKRIGALSKRLNEAISIVVDDLEEFMRGEK